MCIKEIRNVESPPQKRGIHHSAEYFVSMLFMLAIPKSLLILKEIFTTLVCTLLHFQLFTVLKQVYALNKNGKMLIHGALTLYWFQHCIYWIATGTQTLVRHVCMQIHLEIGVHWCTML